jgi:glycerate 2-kinase
VHTLSDPAGLWSAALASVDPERLVSDFFARRSGFARPGGKRGLFAVGKAALGMAMGAASGLFESILVVVPRGTFIPAPWRDRVISASHPEPRRDSVAAARRAVEFFRSFGEGDEIVALVSGGASSLLCLPREGWTLTEKRARIAAAMRAGWPIERLNRLRISLSDIKGGRLAASTRARVTTLVLSDVPGEPRLVGSGPTIGRRKGNSFHLLADNRTGLRAAAQLARASIANVRIERGTLSGEARQAGAAFARRLRALARAGAGEFFLIAGGETTVALGARPGTGGRNQEFAIAAALEISGEDRFSIFCAGSDGVDGNSKNAGARVDGSTVARAAAAGILAEQFLARNDSESFFELAGGAFRPGPTGTNVADWVFGRVAPRGRGKESARVSGDASRRSSGGTRREKCSGASR